MQVAILISGPYLSFMTLCNTGNLFQLLIRTWCMPVPSPIIPESSFISTEPDQLVFRLENNIDLPDIFYDQCRFLAEIKILADHMAASEDKKQKPIHPHGLTNKVSVP